MNLYLAEVVVVASGNKWNVLVKANDIYSAQSKVEGKYDFEVKVYIFETIE